MRKLLLPTLLTAAAFATAAEIEVHGNVNLDYASYFNEDFDPTNAANQDIDLSLKAQLDENVSVIVNGTTKSTYVGADSSVQASEIRHGLARSTAMGSNGRFNSFDFDGAQLRWDVTPDVGIIFGDMTYSAGQINYYFWRDPSRYAVIVREESLRGIGVEVGNEKYGQGKLYFGASEDSESSMALFATYGLPLINRTNEHFVITPSLDWMFGDHIGRSHTYVLGTEIDYTKSLEKFNYGVYAVWGLHPYKGNGVHSFLLEPSMNYAVFNLSATFFHAIVDEDYEAAPQIMTDAQQFFAIEPSFNLHKKLTLGLNYEYRDVDVNIEKDETHYGGLSFYVYPTLNTEVVIWMGYNFDDNNDTDFAMGISGKAEF
ncbi:MAG: hypothetical protein HUK21_07605 [Fibrobacteraceae bacterium]|nr:hypothetical protein [Fibrobacteraceae bacterium]